MKEKICPLCDSRMKRAHYCDTCHSFVWHPEMIDIHYNMEDVGRGAVDCAYGEAHDRVHHGGSKVSKTVMHTRKKKETTRGSSYQEVFGSSETDEKQKKTKMKEVLSKVIAAVIGLNIIGSLLTGATEAIFDGIDSADGFQNIVSEWIRDDENNAPEEEYIAEEAADEWVDISDEELTAYPEGCNGYDHFEVTGEQILEPVTDWLISHYNNCEMSSTANNTKYVYAGMEYLYLEYETTIELPETVNGYVQIESDSVTDQIHEINAYLPNEEDSEEFLVLVVGLLNDNLLSGDVRYEVEAMIGEMSDDYNSVELDNIYLYVTDGGDGSLWMSVSPAY